MPNFTYTANPNGSLSITMDGTVVKEDPADPNYLEFLGWASQQPGTIQNYPFHGTGYFFSEIQPLVNHIKKFGSHLYVTTQGGSHYILGKSDRKFSTSQHAFVNLPKARALPEDEEIEPSGFGSDRKHGLEAIPSSTWVTSALLVQINAELEAVDSDLSEIRRVTTWPIDRSFVYIDVADFSKFPPGQQVLVINSIVKMVEDRDLWMGPDAVAAVGDIQAMMCIGDGYIFVFRGARNAAFFAAYLANLVEVLLANEKLPVEFHFRMGAHVGKVFSFYDPGRKNWNYIGRGINGGQRVLSAIKDADDVLFISSNLRKEISPIPPGPGQVDIVGNSVNRGRRPDKHGEMLRVYEVNHTGIMQIFNSQMNFSNW